MRPTPLTGVDKYAETASLPWVARALGGVTAVTAVLVIIGWLFGVPQLTRIRPEFVDMKFNTAAVFALAGLALAWPEGRIAGYVQRAAGALVLVAGALTLWEYLAAVDLGIDQLFISDPNTRVHPGRMAPVTTIGCVLTGVALLGRTGRRRAAMLIAQVAGFALVVVGFVPVIGYLYGATTLYHVPPGTSMALHTATLFFLWAAGLLASLRGGVLPELMTSVGSGGIVARALLPVAFVIPIGLGWIFLQGRRDGLYSPEFALGLFAALNALVFATVVLLLRHGLDRMDRHRRHSERALTEREALSQHAPVGIFETDVDGACTFANERWCRLAGRSAGEAMGRGWIEAIHPEDRGRMAAAWDTARATGRELALECRLLRRDGRVVWVSATAVERRDAEDNPIGFLATLSDITDRRRAEQEGREAAQSLERSLHEKDVLLREVHHRVKNNLQVISSLLNLQLRTVTDDSARRALAESRDRVHSIALVHQKLYQSQSFAEIDFSDYLETILESLVHAQGRGNRPLVRIVGDRVRLPLDVAVPCALIVNELCTNALKYAFPNGRTGTIEVCLARDDAGAIELAVKDDGVGLPEEMTIGATRSLGLNLVAMLADQIDGQIAVDRNGGTTFTLRFAVGAPAPEPEAQARTA